MPITHQVKGVACDGADCFFEHNFIDENNQFTEIKRIGWSIRRPPGGPCRYYCPKCTKERAEEGESRCLSGLGDI